MNRPTTEQTCGQARQWQAGLPTPLRERLRFAIPCHAVVVAPIVLLFTCCRPDDIARFVVTVIVQAFNPMLWRRTWANITQKCREVITPFFAQANATAAVARETDSFLVFATGNDVAPDDVFAGLSFRSRVSVSGGTFHQAFKFPATAGFRIASPKITGRHMNHCAALTATFVPRLDRPCWRANLSQHCQSSEHHSGQVDLGWHGVILHD